ncbi:hypothetical protein Sango_0384600 [Sesamum angolense]|uniref:Uncharacterized protein n=1 Tax=Sesamum angolense TaxID=2727404 RepID=A0AAE2C3U1_9LAMI|nr:hypothetical protein Sango_0384600 [Sesamum angolense]
MTLWQSGVANPYTMPNNYEAMNMIPKWGLLRSPVVMFTPVSPAAVSPRKTPHGGTGVFLPWTVGSRKRSRKSTTAPEKKFLALPSPIDTHKFEAISDSGVSGP